MLRQSVAMTLSVCKHILNKSVWLHELQIAVAYLCTSHASCVVMDLVNVHSLTLTDLNKKRDNTPSCRGKIADKEQPSSLFCNLYGPLLAQNMLSKCRHLAHLMFSRTDLEMTQASFAKVFSKTCLYWINEQSHLLASADEEKSCVIPDLCGGEGGPLAKFYHFLRPECHHLWHSALPGLLQAAWGTYSRNTSGISSRQQKNPAWQPTCYFSSSTLAGLSLRDMTPLAWLASPLACRSDHEVGRGVLIRSAPTAPASPAPWNSLLRWNSRPLKSVPYKKKECIAISLH